MKIDEVRFVRAARAGPGDRNVGDHDAARVHKCAVELFDCSREAVHVENLRVHWRLHRAYGEAWIAGATGRSRPRQGYKPADHKLPLHRVWRAGVIPIV